MSKEKWVVEFELDAVERKANLNPEMSFKPYQQISSEIIESDDYVLMIDEDGLNKWQNMVKFPILKWKILKRETL